MKKLLIYISFAFRYINNYKLRAFLTIIGIVIGTASVIDVIAIGTGASASVLNQINSLGSNLLIISPGQAKQGSIQLGAGTLNSLTNNDFNSIENKVLAPEVLYVSASSSKGGINAIYKSNNSVVTLNGITPSFFVIRNITMASGSYITDSDLLSGRHDAVLGATVATTLFGSTSAIGKEINLNGNIFTVVGVANSVGSSSSFVNNDTQIYIPITVFQAMFSGNQYLNNILVEATSASTMTAAQNEVTQILLDNHHIQNVNNADFTVTSQTQILSTAGSITQILTILLSSLAGISLVVGGIGIMNIMLVSVTERTKEIGLKKAVGAKVSDILTEFLVESIILTFSGGIIGVAFGWLIVLFIQQVFHFSAILSINSVILSLSVSIITGIIFGLYPSFKASKLSPLEALKYE